MKEIKQTCYKGMNWLGQTLMSIREKLTNEVDTISSSATAGSLRSPEEGSS